MKKEPTTRKSVSLPDDMWRELADYRFTRRIGTEAEAIRRLLQAGLVAEGVSRKVVTKRKGKAG